VTYLLDTNVLIYPHQGSAAPKRERAIELLGRLEARGDAVLPAQALAEFANVALRKLGWNPESIYRQVEDLSQAFAVVPLSEWMVLEAVRGVDAHGLSYCDAQIWAAARLHQIPTVLTEDFASDATLEGVTFMNPFAETFSIADLA
jgi:predicted nucleic acid-binding protein